jgi:integrase
MGYAMKVKLTDRFCSNIKADSRVDYFDEITTGLALRVTDTGSKSWTYNFTIGGKRARMTLGTYPALSLSAARTKAIEARSEVEAGTDPRLTLVGAETFKAVADDYQSRDGSKLRTAAWRKTVVERLVYPILGTRPIRDIRRSEIVRLLDKIEDDNGPVMADRTLAIIQRVMNWHASRDDEFRSPIVRGMYRANGKDRARKRVLTDDEIRVIWTVADRHTCAYDYLLQFILLTATRRNEASDMNSSEVTGTDWVIPAHRYKTNFDQLIPLSAAAHALVSDRKGWIFTANGRAPISGFGKFKAEFDQRVTEANNGTPLVRWTTHDLRRTARTLMSRASVDPDHAERCLGHTLPTIRGTYDLHSYRDEKLLAFNALASLVDRIVHPQDNIVPMRAAQ